MTGVLGATAFGGSENPHLCVSCFLQAHLHWPKGASTHPEMCSAVSPRSLQGGELYQEGPGHGPDALAPVFLDPGLCPLAAGSNVLDPTLVAPESRFMSLALASSKEGCFQTRPLVHGHGEDSRMQPVDATIDGFTATLSDPHSTGRSSAQTRRLHQMLQPLGLV